MAIVAMPQNDSLPVSSRMITTRRMTPRAGLVHVCPPFIELIEAFARCHQLRTTAKLFQWMPGQSREGAVENRGELFQAPVLKTAHR